MTGKKPPRCPMCELRVCFRRTKMSEHGRRVLYATYCSPCDKARAALARYWRELGAALTWDERPHPHVQQRVISLPPQILPQEAFNATTRIAG